jgi:hypothetical protein
MTENSERYWEARWRDEAAENDRLRGREEMLRGLAANDGNPDQHVARRALALMDNITELFHRANEDERDGHR